MPGRSGRRRANSSLFVRGISYSTRSEDLRELFERYGNITDIYVPLDYYTREPRGFAYVQFQDVRDAEDALHYMDGYRLHGKRMEVQYAEGDRKTPNDMKTKDDYHGGGGGGGRRRGRSRSRSPRRRNRRSYSRSRSRSPSPRHNRRRRRSPSYSPSPERSASPYRRSYSRSPSKSPQQWSHSPNMRGHSP